MVTATVTQIIRAARKGGDARAEARSSSLVTESNPKGTVSFYLRPPFWADGRPPHPGQKVMVGEIEEKMRPDWAQPKLLARDVSPAYAIRQYSPRRIAQPTQFASQATQCRGWVARLMAALGFKANSAARATG